MNSFGLYLLKSPTYIFVIANICFDFFLNYCFLSAPWRNYLGEWEASCLNFCRPFDNI